MIYNFEEFSLNEKYYDNANRELKNPVNIG